MNTATATANFLTDLAASAGGAPAWVQLFPAGPELVARDGRRWIADPAAVIAAFASNRGPLPIDYEHGQDHLAVRGEAAPAAGWIVALEDRGGEVWGQVEWTERAAAMIAAREYRFLSPAFNHEKGGRVTRLLGAGLVNRPALEMTALSRETPTAQKEHMMLKAIAKALGLPDDAKEDAILTAIAARDRTITALAGALKIEAGAVDEASVAGAVARLREEAATAAQPGQAELAALRQTLADTQTALTALQKKDGDREIDAALDRVAAEGKITPASRGSWRDMCQAEGGLQRFLALAATLPVICAPTALDGRQTETRSEDVDPAALAARARVYQAEQAAAGRSITISEAVLIVKEQK